MYLTILALVQQSCMLIAATGVTTIDLMNDWEEVKKKRAEKRELTKKSSKNEESQSTIIGQPITASFSSNSEYQHSMKEFIVTASQDGNLTHLEQAVIQEKEHLDHEHMSWYQKTALAGWIREHPNTTELIKIVVYGTVGGYVGYHAKAICAQLGIPWPETIAKPTQTSASANAYTQTSPINASMPINMQDDYVHVEQVNK